MCLNAPAPPPSNTSFRHIVLLLVMPCRAGSSTHDTSFLRLLSLCFGRSREFVLLPLHVILATSLVIFTWFSWRGDTKPRVPVTGASRVYPQRGRLLKCAPNFTVLIHCLSVIVHLPHHWSFLRGFLGGGIKSHGCPRRGLTRLSAT